MNKPDWEALAQNYYAAIFAYCYHFLGNRAEAEEATQDTFDKALRTKTPCEDLGNQKAWLYAIARNTCIDRKRWWKRTLLRFATQESEEVEYEKVPTSAPDSLELTEILRSLILALPIRQREVFILRHWHGFSTQETAELLGIDEGTVKSQLKRSVDRLRSALHEREQDD